MTRLRRALDQNGAPLAEAERQLHQALAEHVEQATNAARNDPHIRGHDGRDRRAATAFDRS
jgi:hypothetical protein